MTYRVTPISYDADDIIVFGPPADYATKAAAMTAAKRLAGRGARFDAFYGPDAIAYRGREITAVVAW